MNLETFSSHKDYPVISVLSTNPENLFEPEFLDFMKVVEMGAQKYAPGNWLEQNGKNSDRKSMHASINRHLAEAYMGQTKDKESGLHPLLHVACRALMLYTRAQRGLIHEADLPKFQPAESKL